MNETQLLAQRAAEISAADAIMAAAGLNALTPEQSTALDEHMSKVDAIDESIARAKKLAALKPAPGLEETRSPAKVHNNQGDKPFANFGDFLLSVRAAAGDHAYVEPRLQKHDLRNAEVRAASGMNETVLADGGFLVSQDTSTALLAKEHEESMLWANTRHLSLGPNSNGLKIPYAEETSRVDGSRWGGVQVYWLDEAQLKIPSKPSLGRLELNLKKLVGLCYVTDELLEDAAALGSYIQTAFSEEFAYVKDNVVLRGTGAGTPLGILNSPSLITVAKETGQPNDTVNYSNVIKMMTRMSPRSFRRAKWYVGSDIVGQFVQMTLPVKNVAGTENVGGSAVYTPPDGASVAPFGRLLGLPIQVIEQASAIGDVGDVILADLSQYLTIEKEMKTASSIHVRFIYDESVFRFVQRMDGAPAWKSALTPAYGSNTQSPFVTLAAR